LQPEPVRHAGSPGTGISQEQPWDIVKSLARIVSGDNDVLVDVNQRELVDLFSGNGTVWLGHANRSIARRLASQARKIWITGGLQTPVHLEAASAIERFFPSTHRVAGIYSTGMEAAEFAGRMARVATGKPGVVGFEKSMHGKSLGTAYLGWENRYYGQLPHFHRLPFVATHDEGDILDRLTATLRAHPVAVVFIEPMQGSGGGHSASDAFYREVQARCRQFGTLLAFDEILTGFYRTGTPFYFSSLDFIPDLVLIGKAMGNGFPVSGVVARKDIPVGKDALPGSTYAGNPLACAAIAATLEQLCKLRPVDKVASIEKTIWKALAPVRELGLHPRGRGAMWIVELPAAADPQAVALRLYERGVFVSYTGRILRLLPAVTIVPDRLRAACAIVQKELSRVHVA
jgi:4-aminobutyrate aminotransferase-like enzyme